VKWVDSPDAPGRWVRKRSYPGTRLTPDLSFWVLVQAEGGLMYLTKDNGLAPTPSPSSLEDERERWCKLPVDEEDARP
jgi:hypothetical protein